MGRGTHQSTRSDLKDEVGSQSRENRGLVGIGRVQSGLNGVVVVGESRLAGRADLVAREEVVRALDAEDVRASGDDRSSLRAAQTTTSGVSSSLPRASLPSPTRS